MALLCLWEVGGHSVLSWRGNDHPPISDAGDDPSFAEQGNIQKLTAMPLRNRWVSRLFFARQIAILLF